ncbi:MAG: toll/interleukin-1 receptor domain-containing protein [Ignavibacteria bacterium]|nr:toll/interleukin-1 receptor domain-containing protein [Ignavibacteria bacterium]
MKIPNVFISYSHDNQEHKKWVLELASRLRNNGIDAILDQFKLQPGDDLTHFMETNLVTADKIIMVCTDKYVEKANNGEGGVGYEKMIITSNLMKKITGNKIIPLIRQNLTLKVPIFLKTKKYINFSDQNIFEYNYDELVRTIHNSPLFKEPPVGDNPFQPVQKVKLDGDIEFLHNILRIIVKTYNGDYIIEIDEIISSLSISKLLAEIGLIKLVKLGYLRWHRTNESVLLTEKGKYYLFENGFL